MSNKNYHPLERPAYQRHWYKEDRTPDERAEIYGLARSLGANRQLAQRLRDMRPGKVQRILAILRNKASTTTVEPATR